METFEELVCKVRREVASITRFVPATQQYSVRDQGQLLLPLDAARPGDWSLRTGRPDRAHGAPPTRERHPGRWVRSDRAAATNVGIIGATSSTSAQPKIVHRILSC